MAVSPARIRRERRAEQGLAILRSTGHVREVALGASQDDYASLLDINGTSGVVRGSFANDKPTILGPTPPVVTFLALSPDGTKALGSAWNFVNALPACAFEPTPPDAVLCQIVLRPTPTNQTGRPLTPEERDRVLVFDLDSKRVIATLRHPGLGVWRGTVTGPSPPEFRAAAGVGASPQLVDRTSGLRSQY